MNKQFTPGPWTVNRLPIQSRGGSNTCFKIEPIDACIYDDWRAYGERGITTDQNVANARLIAAAPEMFELLEKFCEACNKYNIEELVPEYEQARTLLDRITQH